MAKLSHEKIAAEIAAKGYELIDDTQYTNLNSPIVIRCSKGHLIETTLSDFRRPSFCCPSCDRAIQFINPRDVPEKSGYRVIAFDQATEHFGLSIFDAGKLVYYHLYTFTGTVANRLMKIREFVKDIVIGAWKPDYIVCEDIQMQYGAVLTYKVLAMLLGVLEEVFTETQTPYEVVSPNVWRKYAGTCGKNRKAEKLLSVAVVKEKYNVNVNDDVAEAILIGRYGAQNHRPEITMAFGKRN